MTLANIQMDSQRGQPKSIRIKLEIDTNPPLGGEVENKYHDFPLNFSVAAFKLSSLFAGKIQTLLTRNYTKGRDWYDFLWYTARKTEINFILLKNALDQTAKLPSQDHQIDKNWFLSKMGEKIESTDWEEAKKNIHRFMKPFELKSLELWSKNFFLSKLQNF